MIISAAEYLRELTARISREEREDLENNETLCISVYNRATLLRMLRDEAFTGDHTEFYQLSHGLEVEYDQATHNFLRFDYEGEPVDDERIFTVGLQHFHYTNLVDSFDVTLEELRANHMDRVISTSCTQIIEEVLSNGQNQNASGEGRLILHLNRDK